MFLVDAIIIRTYFFLMFKGIACTRQLVGALRENKHSVLRRKRITWFCWFWFCIIWYTKQMRHYSGRGEINSEEMRTWSAENVLLPVRSQKGNPLKGIKWHPGNLSIKWHVTVDHFDFLVYCCFPRKLMFILQVPWRKQWNRIREKKGRKSLFLFFFFFSLWLLS